MHVEGTKLDYYSLLFSFKDWACYFMQGTVARHIAVNVVVAMHRPACMLIAHTSMVVNQGLHIVP